MSSGPRPPYRPADLLTAAMSRRLQPGPARYKITVDRGVQVPMRDGTILVADHYAPLAGGPRPTVLMRCPYGRGLQWAMLARPIAEHGYHVLLQSNRGTFGSGGRFMPAVNEAADGQDTVAWLRGQHWFSGKLALVGPSYLAFSAWALAADPPPELTALALYISPHDLAAAGFGQGPFELFNLLMWSDLLASQERVNPLRMAWRIVAADRRLARMADKLPIAATAAGLIQAGAAWYADWLEHTERDDPYYDCYSAAAALDRVTAPTLLISGFHDFFIEQTTRQYQALRDRGVPAGLIIGPWTHMTLDMGLALRETIGWLDGFADGNEPGSHSRKHGVLVWTTGADRWDRLPDWPPAGSAPQAWYLQPGRGLAGPMSVGAWAGATATTFRYDPANPTPSVGGRIISVRRGGSLDNSAVEARSDVLTFTTAPLDQPVRVAGVPAVELYISSDNAHCDIFARLCDVDEAGRSLNLTDQIIRCSPADAVPGEVRRVRITLTDVSHVFREGHRIRLQISGGAHPRFARNLGTGADMINSTRTAPVRHQVQHSGQYPSALIMPVVSLAAPAEAAQATTQRVTEAAAAG